MAWARQFGRPTLFVAGNHEFYGSDLVSTLRQLREAARGTQVRILERDEWIVGDVRFLGCTLWSDYRIFPDDETRERGLAMALELVRDFSRIALAPGSQERLTQRAARRLFDESVAWLEDRFAEPHGGPTVVVTHFAPSLRSIHPRFEGSPINACFVSDLERHILRWQPALWLHGHTHDSFDYCIGQTHVLANPRGYAPGGVVENAIFDPGFHIEIPSLYGATT
jgi:Icc-related predicted phosphoesterase